jgi:hypothetical protein
MFCMSGSELEGLCDSATDIIWPLTEAEESLQICRELDDKADIAGTLNNLVITMLALAGVSLSQGDAQRAVRLPGSGAAALEASGVPLFPMDRLEYEHILSTSRLQLKGPAWQAAWEEGQAMPVEWAIAYALEEAGQTRAQV